MDISKQKNILRHIKKYLIFDISFQGGIYVFALAANKEYSKNHVQTIKFDSGIALSAGVYDSYNDCFYARCEDYTFIGLVSLSVSCTVKDNQNWAHKIPLSRDILNKILNKADKKTLRDFVKKYPEEKYKIEFLQLYNSKCK